MPPSASEVKRWLEKADRDRRTAEAALSQSPPITDTAAFHAQQAAEKLLKGFLVSRSKPFERIHDLAPLCELCAADDPTFKAFVHRVAPLTAYAVRFRYPGPADPTVQQVRDALDVVDELRAFVVSRIPS